MSDQFDLFGKANPSDVERALKAGDGAKMGTPTTSVLDKLVSDVVEKSAAAIREALTHNVGDNGMEIARAEAEAHADDLRANGAEDVKVTETATGVEVKGTIRMEQPIPYISGTAVVTPSTDPFAGKVYGEHADQIIMDDDLLADGAEEHNDSNGLDDEPEPGTCDGYQEITSDVDTEMEGDCGGGGHDECATCARLAEDDDPGSAEGDCGGCGTCLACVEASREIAEEQGTAIDENVRGMIAQGLEESIDRFSELVSDIDRALEAPGAFGPTLQTVPVRDLDGSIIGTMAAQPDGTMRGTIPADSLAGRELLAGTRTGLSIEGPMMALEACEPATDFDHALSAGSAWSDKMLHKAEDDFEISQKEIRILHLADLHLSEHATLAGAVRRDEQGRNVAMQDTIKACVDAALAAQPLAGIIIAGDVFDRPRPTPNEEHAAATLFENLARLVPSRKLLAIVGNHDCPNGTADADALTSMTWHENAFVVSKPQVLDYAGLRVACLPFPRRGEVREWGPLPDGVNEREALCALLKVRLQDMAAERPDCLVAHAAVTGATIGVQPRPLQGDLEIDKETLGLFPAGLLGHVHQPQRTGATSAYAGDPVVGDFGEADGWPRGALLWRFDRATRALLGFETVEVEQREWVTVEVGTADAVESAFTSAGTVDMMVSEPGSVYRVRGNVSRETADAVRSIIRSKRVQGFWVQDEVQALAEDRARDKTVADVLDDEQVVVKALASRGVVGEEAGRAVALLRELTQEGVGA